MAARSSSAVIDTPTSIQVVTSEFMDDIGASSILDATMYLSGVTVPALGGTDGFQQRQTVRGFDITGGTTDNFTPSASWGSIDPAIIDRVEVLKGPNSILAPMGPPGGFVNSITKSPKFADTSHMLRAEAADQYFGSKATLDSTGRLFGSERFAYRIVSSYRDSKSYVPGRLESKSLNPMFTWAISEKTQLKFKSFNQNWRHKGAVAAGSNNMYLRDDFPIGGTVSSSPSDYRPGYKMFGSNGSPTWIMREEKSRNATIELTTSVFDKVDIRLAAMRMYRHAQELNGGLELWRGYPASNKRINPYTGIWTETLSWDLQDPSLPHDVSSNPYISSPVDYTSLNYSARLGEGVFHWWLHETLLQLDTISHFDFGGSSENPAFRLNVAAGIFRRKRTDIQMRWSMAGETITGTFDKTQHFMNEPPRPNPDAWKVEGLPDWFKGNPRGVWLHNENFVSTRQQIYVNTSFETFGGRLFGSLGSANDGRDTHSGNHLTGGRSRVNRTHTAPPSYALLFKVRPTFSIYAAHSESSLLSSRWAGSAVGTVEVWRDGAQNELGIKLLFFNNRLSVTSSYFDIKQNNIGFVDPRAADLPFGSPNIYPDLLLDITNEGFELDIAGQVTDNLSILGSATKQKKRDHLGRKQANTQDDLFNLFVNYKFSSGTLKGFGMHVGMNYAGTSVGENVGPQKTPLGVIYQSGFNMPSRTIFNAGASYRLGKAKFQLNIDNLADSKKPYVSGGRAGIGHVPPRNIRLTTTYSF